mmetsp:Transcript_25548/g.33138  ORF Transcript_25548/g.33138 Transcript_25548/m.33138 type:complete len:581 (+) Transcript_25548:141-1883(+)
MKGVFKKIGSFRPKKDKEENPSTKNPEKNDQQSSEGVENTAPPPLDKESDPVVSIKENSSPKASHENGPSESNSPEPSKDVSVVEKEPQQALEQPIKANNPDRSTENAAPPQPNPMAASGPMTGNLKKKGGEAFEISMTPAKATKKSTKPNHSEENHSDSDVEFDLKQPAIEVPEDSTEEEVEKEALQKCKEAFGHDTAYNLQSTQWANRKEGIETINFKIVDLKAKIQEGTDINPDELKEKFTVSLLITRRALKDPVAPVCFSAFELFRNSIKVFSPILDTSLPIKNVCGSLVGPLLTKMSGEKTGTNKRNQREACKCLLRLARTPQVEGLGIIVSKLNDDSLPLRPRLSLLKLLINEFEFAKGPGLKLQMVMAITLPAMQIADDKTRKAAVGVIVAAYEIAGKRVLKHLNSVKPAMLKIIHRKLKESDEARGVLDSPFFTDPTPTGERPKTGAARKLKKQADEMQVAGRAYLPHLDPSNSPVLQRNQPGPESDQTARFSEGSPYKNNAMESNMKPDSAQASPTDKKQMMRDKFQQQNVGAYGMGGNVWSANDTKKQPPSTPSNMALEDELLMDKILNS